MRSEAGWVSQEEAREHLLAGGVVAAATESFFGLLAAADRPNAAAIQNLETWAKELA